MISFTLDIKPLSINEAYQGRRFNTPAKRQYDTILALSLPKVKEPGPYYRIGYVFHLKNFGNTDTQNLLKCLTDGIVRSGIIKDDRYVVDERLRKFPAKENRIEVTVESVAAPHFFFPKHVADL